MPKMTRLQVMLAGIELAEAAKLLVQVMTRESSSARDIEDIRVVRDSLTKVLEVFETCTKEEAS